MQSPLDHCAQQVRTYDRERYACTLFLPEGMREAAWVVLAWNIEVATVGEMVSEEMIGLIRFTWWREALDEIYEGRKVRRHPVAEALAGIIPKYNLPRAPFDALLEARARDLQPLEFETLAELGDYAASVNAPVFELIAAILQSSEEEDQREGAKTIGEAWGLVGMLWALPFYAKRGIDILPKEITSHCASVQESVMEVARHAQNILASAKNEKPFAVFYHNGNLMLERVSRFKGDVFHPLFASGRFWRLSRLWLRTKSHIFQ